MTVMTETEILKSIIPKAKVDSITLENGPEGPDQILVTAKFCVYDTVGRGAIGQFFDGVNYEKYFLIHERLTWRYEGSNQAPNLRSNLTTKDLVPEIASDINSPDGSKVKKFNFEVKHTINLRGQKIRNLNFQVITKYDVDELERELDIDIFSIFDSRNISNEDYDNDGAPDVLENHEIAEVMVDGRITYPIRDFRNSTTRQTAARVDLNDENIISEYQLRFEQQALEIEKRKETISQHLSDFWITRSASGVARFLFIYDPNYYFSCISPYRKFYNNMNATERARVVGNMEIPSLRVYRKRVLKVHTSEGNVVVPYQDTDTETVIVETSKRKGFSSFQRALSEKGRIRQIDISTSGVLEGANFLPMGIITGNINQDYTNNELFFLTGDDTDVAELGRGDYVYGVSVTVADNVKDYLLEGLREMIDGVTLLEAAYLDIYSSENYDVQNNVYLSGGVENILGDDIYENIDNIIKNYKNAIRLFGPSGAYDTEVNPGIIRLLDMFRRPDAEDETSNIDIYSLRVLIDSISSIISSAFASLGESTESCFREPGDQGLGVSSGISRQIPRDRATTMKYYDSVDKVFEADVPKRCYLDYLSNFSEYMDLNVLEELNTLSEDTGEIGVRVIDGASFESRMETELSRVFTASSGNITSNSDTSEVRRVDMNIDIGASITGSGSEYILPAGVVRDSLLETTLESLNAIEFVSRFDATQEDMILAAHNISFYNEHNEGSIDTLLKDDLGLDSFAEQRIPASERNEENDPTVMRQDIRERHEDFEKFIYSKVKEIMSLPDRNQPRMFSNVDHSRRHNREYSEVQVSREEFEEGGIPNLIRALMAPDQPIVRNTEILQGEATVYSELLMKIEYLEGFNSNVYTTSTLSPIWKPLTLDEYRSNASRSLLCRIVPTEYNSLGIRTTDTGVPVYDSFFVIKPVSVYTIATPVLRRLRPEITSDAFVANYRARMSDLYSELQLLIRDLMEILIQHHAFIRGIEAFEYVPEGSRTEFAELQLRRYRRDMQRTGRDARRKRGYISDLVEDIKMLYSEASQFIPE